MNALRIIAILAVAAGAAAQADAQPASATRPSLIAERGLTAADFPQIKQLAPNVYAWTDVHPTGLYTTNDLIVITPDGVLVADGQKDAATTQKLVDGIKKLTSQPIKFVVVCSEHGDHAGGNSAFPSAATVVTSARDISLGGTDIRIVNNGRAHTGSDIEVYLPKERIFFASEVFSNHLFPQTRASVPTEWIETVRRVQQVDAGLFIAGHGFIDGPDVMKAELAAFERSLQYIVAEVTRLHTAGIPIDAAIKQVNWGPYAAWPLVDRNGETAVRRVYDELDGKLK